MCPECKDTGFYTGLNEKTPCSQGCKPRRIVNETVEKVYIGGPGFRYVWNGASRSAIPIEQMISR